MFKKYFIELWEKIKEIGIFTKNNFKKNMLPIWLLIILQMILTIPCLYMIKETGFSNLSLTLKITNCAMFVIFLFVFFITFKKIFNMASNGLEKEKLSNLKIIKSLLTLGLFNCTPIFLLFICFNLAKLIPGSEIFFKIGLNIFTYIFYLAMSLSIGAICYWNNKNVFIAILKSLKTFFKKLKYTLPLFLLIFFFAVIITFLICSILYAIAIKLGVLNGSLVNSIHAMMNVNSLYVISGLYIGTQISILKEEE